MRTHLALTALLVTSLALACGEDRARPGGGGESGEGEGEGEGPSEGEGEGPSEGEGEGEEGEGEGEEVCPTVSVGAACTTDSDCGDVGLCWMGFDDVPMPGGYCTVNSDLFCCPDGAVSYTFDNDDGSEISYCLDSCTEDTDCREAEGYLCDADDTCYAAEECPDVAVGSPCTTDADCGDGGLCWTEADDAMPGGYCTVDGDLSCCPDGSDGFVFDNDDGTESTYCLALCDNDSECRGGEGYACDVDGTCYPGEEGGGEEGEGEGEGEGEEGEGEPANGCAALVDIAACQADPDCAWLVPGCAEGMDVPNIPAELTGCHPVTGCSEDGCEGEQVCTEFVHDPCVGQMCDACGGVVSVCADPMGEGEGEEGEGEEGEGEPEACPDDTCDEACGRLRVLCAGQPGPADLPCGDGACNSNGPADLAWCLIDQAEQGQCTVLALTACTADPDRAPVCIPNDDGPDDPGEGDVLPCSGADCGEMCDEYAALCPGQPFDCTTLCDEPGVFAHLEGPDCLLAAAQDGRCDNVDVGVCTNLDRNLPGAFCGPEAGAMDMYDPNQDQNGAADIDPGVHENLVIHAQPDADWYRMDDACPGSVVDVRIDFDGERADLDLDSFYWGNGRIDQSDQMGTDEEHLTLNIDEDADLILGVYIQLPPANTAYYDLQIGVTEPAGGCP